MSPAGRGHPFQAKCIGRHERFESNFAVEKDARKSSARLSLQTLGTYEGNCCSCYCTCTNRVWNAGYANAQLQQRHVRHPGCLAYSACLQRYGSGHLGCRSGWRDGRLPLLGHSIQSYCRYSYPAVHGFPANPRREPQVRVRVVTICGRCPTKRSRGRFSPCGRVPPLSSTLGGRLETLSDART